MELRNEFRVGVGVDKAWEVLTDVERIAPCLPGAELREIEGDEYRGVVKVKVGPITAEYKGAAHFIELDTTANKAVLKAEGRETRGQGNASATITAQLEPDGEGTKVSVVTDLAISGKVAQFGRGVLADVSTKLLGQFVDNLETTVLQVGGGAEEVTKEAAKEGAAAGKPAAEQPKPAARSTATRTSQRGRKEPAGSGNGSGPAAEAGEESPGDGAAGEGQAAAEEPAGGGGATVRRLEPRHVEPVDLVEVAGRPVGRRLLPVLAGLAVGAILFAVIRRLLRSQP